MEKKIVALTNKKEGKVFSITEENELKELFSFKTISTSQDFRACKFLPADKYFITAQNNPQKKQGSLTKWSADSDKPILTRDYICGGNITSIQISPNGQYIAVGSNSGDIIVVTTHQLVPTMHLTNVHQLPVTGIGFFHESRKTEEKSKKRRKNPSS